MIQYITGFWMSRAVYIAAKLGLPDLLQSGPKTTDELAQATGTHPPSLYRVLRALTSAGVFKKESDGRFGLTPLSETFVTNTPGTMRWFLISELGQEHYPAWGNVMHSVKTGEIAFDNQFGADVWQYFANNPEDAAVFNDSMSANTAAANQAIMAAYDFSPFKTVIDIGGGHGGLITSILQQNPQTKGVLFDAPPVIEGARAKLEQAGVADRCQAIAGDFFKEVPGGADAYVMKWIIHDWEDQKAIAILKNCRKHMQPNNRLLIVDCVVPDNDAPDFSKTFDLNMMVMTGGKERTEKEFSELLQASGFKLLRTIPTDFPTSIVEGQPI
jgi:ubiquinone/menaquinone biosynthesis C-methylase UbiE